LNFNHSGCSNIDRQRILFMFTGTLGDTIFGTVLDVEGYYSGLGSPEGLVLFVRNLLHGLLRRILPCVILLMVLGVPTKTSGSGAAFAVVICVIAARLATVLAFHNFEFTRFTRRLGSGSSACGALSLGTATNLILVLRAIVGGTASMRLSTSLTLLMYTASMHCSTTEGLDVVLKMSTKLSVQRPVRHSGIDISDVVAMFARWRKIFA
jgi:hypothetical protein